MLRVSVEGLCLQILAMGFGPIHKFLAEALDTPLKYVHSVSLSPYGVCVCSLGVSAERQRTVRRGSVPSPWLQPVKPRDGAICGVGRLPYVRCSQQRVALSLVG